MVKASSLSPTNENEDSKPTVSNLHRSSISHTISTTGIGKRQRHNQRSAEENRAFADNSRFRASDSHQNIHPKFNRLKEKIHSIKFFIKKLFRSIVRKIHPDLLPSRLATAYYKEMFLEAVNAREMNDVSTLVRISAQCGINDDNLLAAQIEILQKRIADLSVQIDAMIFSHAWTWYHAKGEARTHLMLNFINR